MAERQGIVEKLPDNPTIKLSVFQRAFLRLIGCFFLGHSADKPIRIGILRWLVSRGFSPFWYPSADSLQRYWYQMSNQAERSGNRPQFYANKSQTINFKILDIIKKLKIDVPASVFEVGCNAGTNLEFWRNQGVKEFGAIEIGSAALEELNHSYVELSRNVNIWEGSLEEKLPEIPRSSFDLLFSMAVLEHVHPSSFEVFRGMSDIACSTIVICEREDVHTMSMVPRNYQYVFERMGWFQVYDETLTEFQDSMYDNYTIRVFVKTVKP